MAISSLSSLVFKIFFKVFKEGSTVFLEKKKSDGFVQLVDSPLV